MHNETNRDYRGYKVLIFGAGGRQTLAVSKGFHDIGCEVTTYCMSRLDTGFLTRYADHKILYDKNSKTDFYEYGCKIIANGKYDLVVPMGDKTATFLSNNKERLKQYSKIAVNDTHIFQYAIDKYLTMRVCMNNNIPVPYTANDGEIEEDIKNGKLKMPVVVKPKTAVGSIGFKIIKTVESLLEYLNRYNYEYGPLLVQEYIPQGNSPQFRADLFRDRNGEYKAAIVGKVTRWYPLDGGSGIHIETVHDDFIIEKCEKLLDILNWNGYANIDIVWDSKRNIPVILEINGRVGASIMQDYVSGINISQLILENEMGIDVSNMLEYEDGAQVSCFLPDLLWFIKSPDRFGNNMAWFRRKGVKDTIFSISDPIPSIGFLIESIMNYRKSMKMRQR